MAPESSSMSIVPVVTLPNGIVHAGPADLAELGAAASNCVSGKLDIPEPVEFVSMSACVDIASWKRCSRATNFAWGGDS